MIRVLNIIVVFLLSLSQIYWAMNEYADSPSSACIGSSHCGFTVDVLVLSLFTVIFFVLTMLVLKKITDKQYLKSIIQTISLITFWLWANNSVFVDRVASWSTYSMLDEWAYILNNKMAPIMVCAGIYLIFSVFINRRFKEM